VLASIIAFADMTDGKPVTDFVAQRLEDLGV
jgi:hypothetical protein